MPIEWFNNYHKNKYLKWYMVLIRVSADMQQAHSGRRDVYRWVSKPFPELIRWWYIWWSHHGGAKCWWLCLYFRLQFCFLCDIVLGSLFSFWLWLVGLLFRGRNWIISRRHRRDPERSWYRLPLWSGNWHIFSSARSGEFSWIEVAFCFYQPLSWGGSWWWCSCLLQRWRDLLTMLVVSIIQLWKLRWLVFLLGKLFF